MERVKLTDRRIKAQRRAKRPKLRLKPLAQQRRVTKNKATAAARRAAKCEAPRPDPQESSIPACPETRIAARR